MATATMIFAVLALVVCPFAYMTLCIRMRKADVQRPPYLPLFFVFGTIGGLMLALALSPSGLAAMCIIFLVTFAAVALGASAIYLATQPQRSIYHRLVIWSGFAYPALLALWILVIIFLR